ncbi:hypothetical protein F4677DRAFT_404032 [Hypoxylon crocopeplum]|nr:hypothetical protein F4677DRAFT_404032 [Hypoxylon crocopeplum]
MAGAGPAVKQQRRKATMKPKVPTAQQHASSSISSFTRVSKTVTKTDVKKEELFTAITTPKKDIILEATTPASRKRKVVASIEEEDTSADETPRKLTLSTPKSAKATSQPIKRGRGRPSKKARPEPASKKRARSPSVSDSDESAINAGTLFKRLRLESSPSCCSSPVTANTSIADSESDGDSTTPKKTRQLPNEVLDLIDLHSSFLKTLTLHYAHNGSNVPADLRVLCPNVARAWGKKRVTDADIRICLGVLNLAQSNTSETKSSQLFSLSNYGRGKVCIEIDMAQQRPGRPLDEKKLNDQFRGNLTSLWSRFAATNNASEPSTFLATLPKAPVTLCASLAKAAPVLSKGQKRLEELKHGIAIKRQEKEANKPQQNKDTDVPMPNVEAPKLSLLDRIRLKSLQRSASALTELTPAQLERRAALQRAPEVAALLAMLSRAAGQGGSRVSFTMAATLEKLKDSFRMGISRDEGAACVRLLGREVAPEWVRVVTLGGRENVVIETDREVSRALVEGRVRGLLDQQ